MLVLAMEFSRVTRAEPRGLGVGGRQSRHHLSGQAETRRSLETKQRYAHHTLQAIRHALQRDESFLWRAG